MTVIQAGGPGTDVQPRGRHEAVSPPFAPRDEADEPIRFEVNPQPAAGALILMQVGKIYDSAGLRFTEKDRADWVLVVDLVIEAAVSRVQAEATAT